MKNLKQNNSREKGFSLIELMIVIAIIGLLIAVGVPAWGYMVRTGNETAAIDTVRQIADRQAQYASKRRGEFGTFDELIKETGLNENLKGENPAFNGYVFKLKVEKRAAGKAPFWSVNADPEGSGSGVRHFYTDSGQSTIKVSEEGEADATSPPL